MIRALLLAALALACVCSPAAAISLGQATLPHAAAFSWSTFALGAVAAGLAVVLMAYAARRSTLPNVRDAMALAGAMLGLFVAFPALAADDVVVVSPTVVSTEWGPYLEVVLRWLSDAAVPLLTALIGGYLFRTYPMLRMILSEAIIESTLSKWADYGINATAGAAKGKTLDVDVGSEALANMLRRGQERASASNVSAWVMKAGGGPEEVAKKLFRKLTLDEDASGAQVLPKALEKAGVAPVLPGPSARDLREMDEMTRR